MFVPHGRNNAEFGETWGPPDKVQKPLIFIRFQAMRGNKLWGDVWFCAAFGHSRSFMRLF
jgi:hypothetical protein